MVVSFECEKLTDAGPQQKPPQSEARDRRTSLREKQLNKEEHEEAR